MALFIEIFGWIGSAALILAYALISTNRVQNNSRLYQLLNLAGSICLIVNTAFNHAYPSTFVNVVWAFIAMFALVSIVRRPARTI